MSFAQHLKLNKKRGQLAWWSRRNKNYIATADSNTSIIANMEQDIIGQCNVTKKSQVSMCVVAG